MALLEMGLALAEAATGAVFAIARNVRIKSREQEIAEYNKTAPENKQRTISTEMQDITQSINLHQSVVKGLTDATGSAFKAGIHFGKADIEMMKAEAEADKVLLDKMMETMNDTMNELRTGSGEVAKQIDSIFGLAQSSLQALQQIFTPN